MAPRKCSIMLPVILHYCSYLIPSSKHREEARYAQHNCRISLAFRSLQNGWELGWVLQEMLPGCLLVLAAAFDSQLRWNSSHPSTYFTENFCSRVCKLEACGWIWPADTFLFGSYNIFNVLKIYTNLEFLTYLEKMEDLSTPSPFSLIAIQ